MVNEFTRQAYKSRSIGSRGHAALDGSASSISQWTDLLHCRRTSQTYNCSDSCRLVSSIDEGRVEASMVEDNL